MSYQVLARKYRPKSFQTLVGQEHVVRALTHALEQQRLHHAYLFTGTRGVGKTTLSRILAKSLNCETGITANPCGVCDACVAIDAGRFVDYIEMDAASNRGVDEMAQLLEQAVYAPSNARFKVYMIDEVHMLTNHAFNSMLKTLEEPPAHVKFILATTDPQKIPVTVLSRCLQFNLKQMPLTAIVGHLENILGQETIQFELPALRLLAQGAQGSMRDALSLTDQAIAYAAGTVSLEAVQGMLGALDQTYLIKICDALAEQDGAGLLAVADQMATRSLSYKAALQDLASLLHQLSIAQLVPAAIPNDLPERAEILRLASLFDAEQIQLFYQIAVHGRNELSLAPDEYAGFSMTLLRMLAFRPVTGEAAAMLSAPAAKSSSNVTSNPASAAMRSAVATPAANPSRPAPAPVAMPAQVQAQARTSTGVEGVAPAKINPAMAALAALNSRRGAGRNVEPASATPPAPLPWEELDSAAPVTVLAEKKTELNAEAEFNSEIKTEPVRAVAPATSLPAAPILPPAPVIQGVSLLSGGEWDGNWPRLSAGLSLRGVAQQLAQQSELLSCEVTPHVITFGLRVPLETLLTAGSADKLASVLSEHFTVPVKLTTEIGQVQRTAHAEAIVERAVRQDAAEGAIKNDLLVQGLMREFGATIVPNTIKPIN
ncbi:DNA polymerase III subunit gamma/tau [Solimicrobium silvestre]|uniref:DNA polymerase III subunit gamma/tau n=1 Tax=Solimicrobium silvestre TaxID=2099400 RepID=A0A2S9GZ30_9BURK|nr:DNA polymerase III subunit gamma/tau [Solimicrobium silvestre]PRC92958.1 DNA polymerase III, subunit gamma and tau [Solimicrobium silvestre]